MLATRHDRHVADELAGNYFAELVNAYFKILPIRENKENTLPVYLDSLQLEMLGCQNLIPVLQTEPSFLELLAILQALIDRPELDVKTVKREVFKAIRICKRLADQYGAYGRQDGGAE